VATSTPPQPVARHPRDTPDVALLREYAATRDPLLREALAERYLPLARHTAARFKRGREPLDDLVQVACVGLLKAIDRYDPDAGAAFSSYAMPTMLGEIRRYFRDHSWTVRPPRDLQEQALAVAREADRLTAERGTSPSIGELAEATGLGEEDVLEARMAINGRGATSLTPMDDDNDGERDYAAARRMAITDDGYARAEDRRFLDDLARVLPARDREILRLRFEEDLTQAEIGERVGLSQMHVSRLIRDALANLRHAAAPKIADPASGTTRNTKVSATGPPR
jgi:RNA polymerase sigma-B factor